MKLLLVEDEPDLGAGLKRTLNQEAYIVDWVLDGDEAWCCLENQWGQYTLAIFDWLLPGLSGLELCQRLRNQNKPLPVLMLTAKDRMEDKVAGLDAGADDYLVKPFSTTELLARVRALHRRSPQFQPQQLQIGHLTLDYGLHTLQCQKSDGNEQIIQLTMREFQLVEFFMKRPNQVVNRDQIINQLWEMGTEPISNVVAAQMSMLRRKLAENGCEGFVETLYGLGYRFNPTYESK